MRLEFKFKGLGEIVSALDGKMFERLKRNLLAVMITQKQEVWSEQRSPDGDPWQKLSDGRAKELIGKNKKKNDKRHRILFDTGALRNSLAGTGGDPGSLSSTSGDEVMIGSNLPYAAIQNFGGVIERSTLHESFHKNRESAGLASVYVVIPARPFIGIGDQDQEIIHEMITLFMNKNTGWKK